MAAYFDHAATTPLDPAVLEAMRPYLAGEYGNPASLYELANRAERAVERARAQVAALLGAEPREIVFTSGGTEGDNWALKALALREGRAPGRVVTSTVEHHAVIESAEYLEKLGGEVTHVAVDGHGRVDPAAVAEALDVGEKPAVASIMAANNEVGTIEPVGQIAALCRERGVPFHTDAVQAVGKVPFDAHALGVDLASISSHKIYGPKGVGAMYVRRGFRLAGFMHGGAQERGRRAGTVNVAGVVGLGKAAELAREGLEAERARLAALGERLAEGLLGRVPKIAITGHPTERLPGFVSFTAQGVEGEAMLLGLDAEGFAVSSGSACTTGSLEPSHVLLAMGIPPEVAHGSVRISLGRENTGEEVGRFLEVFGRVVERLRAMSPTWKG